MSSHYEQYTLFLTQKQIQEDAIQFKFISSITRAAIIVIDDQFKILWENYAVQELFQKRSILQIIKDAQYYNQKITTKFEKDLEDYISNKQPIQKPFQKVFLKNFQIYGSQDNYQVLEIEALNTIWQGQDAVILNILDITDIQKEIQKIENIKQEDRYKDLFLRSLNYEVHDPVQSIQKASHQLLSTLEDIHKDKDQEGNRLKEEMLNFIEIMKAIYQKSRKLMNVTGQLHEIVQIQSKSIQINYNAFKVKQLLKEAISMIRKDVERKNINLSIEISSKVPAQINSDYNKILYTLQNMLFNSVKYTERGKITIKVKPSVNYKSQEEQEEFDLYKFIVYDTGKGLDVQTFNDKPFQQGFGLGLYISSQMAYVLSERYIEVKSEIDSFSKFSFFARAKKV